MVGHAQAGSEPLLVSGKQGVLGDVAMRLVDGWGNTVLVDKVEVRGGRWKEQRGHGLPRGGGGNGGGNCGRNGGGRWEMGATGEQYSHGGQRGGEESNGT